MRYSTTSCLQLKAIRGSHKTHCCRSEYDSCIITSAMI